MIQRDEYLQKLIAFKDKRVIKVVTGIRRCGKSTLFELFQNYLAARGVKKTQIHPINFEDADHEPLTDYRALHRHLKQRLVAGKMNYLFLDEIQNVADFQKAVNSLHLLKNVDLYLTGSNARLLSGELATLLSGRYVEIKMLPLSFKEYVSARPASAERSRLYRDYLLDSSFPYTLELDGQRDLIRDYLGGIYHTVVLKDIVARKKIADAAALENVIRFMFDNAGNLCSVKKISDTLAADGRKISPHTVAAYLSALEESYVLYRAGRYDVRGRQHLKTGEKYYLADIGLRYYLLGAQKADHGRALENTVYLELLRRGGEVSVGKVADREVDFVTVSDSGVAYYQVALTVRDQKTLARELAALDAIADHHPKFLLTLDDDPPATRNGIRCLNALDWLLG